MSRVNQLFLVYLLVVTSLAHDCGGNCLDEDCPECLCGITPSKASVETWCELHDWNRTCCECIVNRSSNGNFYAMKYREDGTYDVGLFAINTIFWDMCNKGKAPCDPVQNIKCAIKVHRQAQETFNNWPAAEECGCKINTELSVPL